MRELILHEHIKEDVRRNRLLLSAFNEPRMFIWFAVCEHSGILSMLIEANKNMADPDSSCNKNYSSGVRGFYYNPYWNYPFILFVKY